MKPLLIRIPEPYLEALDDIVKNKGYYPNRAEAIRNAIRDMIHSEGRFK